MFSMLINTCYCYLHILDVCELAAVRWAQHKSKRQKNFSNASLICKKNCWMNQCINLWLSETDDKQISHTSQDMLCNAPAQVEEISHWIKIYLYIRFLIVTFVGARSLAVVLRIWITGTKKIIICQSVHYTRQYEEARKVTRIVLRGEMAGRFLTIS
jgi:hypothetical protein